MQLTIIGVPLQKQSARFFKRGNHFGSYQPKKITDWTSQARMQILDQLKEYPDFKPFEGAIIIKHLKFIFPPISSWNKQDRMDFASGKIMYKKSRPDLDNLQKQLWDTLNGIVIIDDAQIVLTQNVCKIYGEVPRIELELMPLNLVIKDGEKD